MRITQPQWPPSYNTPPIRPGLVNVNSPLDAEVPAISPLNRVSRLLAKIGSPKIWMLQGYFDNLPKVSSPEPSRPELTGLPELIYPGEQRRLSVNLIVRNPPPYDLFYPVNYSTEKVITNVLTNANSCPRISSYGKVSEVKEVACCRR